jgi:hypothetical protein
MRGLVVLFLPADLIGQAITNLSASRAQPRLLEFLIFKRAVVLFGGRNAHIVTGLGSPAFQTAIREWAISGQEDDLAAYFNPFGASREKTGGYRKRKYGSNGPSDTVSGWGSQFLTPPFARVPDVSPMTFTYAETPSEQLQRGFLKSESADESINRQPRLIDTAIWWLRSRDLESVAISRESEPRALVEILIKENDLTNTEISGIFDATDLSLPIY